MAAAGRVWRCVPLGLVAGLWCVSVRYAYWYASADRPGGECRIDRCADPLAVPDAWLCDPVAQPDGRSCEATEE